MKQTLIILFFLSNQAFGQLDSVYNWNYGINISSNLVSYTDPSITLAFQTHNKKSYFSIGPRLFYPSDDRYHRFGADVNCRIVPFPTGKKLDFYFSFLLDLTYQRYSDVTYIDPVIPQAYVTKDLYLGAFIGYGFTFKLGRMIHLNQFFAIGSYTYSSEITRAGIPAKNVPVYHHKFPMFLDSGISYLVNLGIGFDLK